MPAAPVHLAFGILLAGAVGAVVMCLLVLAYGFAPPEEPSPERARRLLVVRFGHALAAACFGATIILAVTMLVKASEETGAAAVVDRSDDAIGQITRRAAALEERIGALEAKGAAALVLEDRFAELERVARQAEDHAEVAAARVAESRETIGQLAARIDGAEALGRRVQSRLAGAEQDARQAGQRAQEIERGMRRLTDDLAETSERLARLERSATVPRPPDGTPEPPAAGSPRVSAPSRPATPPAASPSA
ncbi:MAG TPA: hypothetical protein VNI83_12700, partial [Vicinamibacterales bacterium]|nr:hypothetical protein [Vicinamibacterales bacterium]